MYVSSDNKWIKIKINGYKWIINGLIVRTKPESNSYLNFEVCQ